MCEVNSGVCGWIELDHDRDRVGKGGGRGRQVTVRYGCTETNDREVAWRSTVDVDVVDMWDPPFRTRKKIYSNCYPSW